MYCKIIMIGRLTRDPELKVTQGGIPVCSFTVAVDRPMKGGEKKTDFINVVAWRNRAEFVSRYFSKGKPILVEGQLQTRDYTDNNGETRKVYEVVADEIRFTLSDNDKKSNGLQGFEEVDLSSADLPF